MKKTILGLFVLSTLLLLNGCNNNKNIIEDITDIQDTENDVEYIKEDCMIGCRIMWNGNTNNEGKSKSEMEKDCNSLCEAGQAMQNNDLNSCDKSEGIMKDSCISSIAQETNDSKACAKISDGTMKRGCYAGLAEKLKNPSICDQIEDNMWKEICVESTKSE